MIDRRIFLKASGVIFLAGLDPWRRAALADTDAVFASACMKVDGRYAAAVFTEHGEILHVEDCPARAHDVVVCPTSGRLAAFARRPGTFAIVFDRQGRNPPLTITSAPGRHFFGHGVFSPDGRLLYATENDFDAARGVIGIYDASDRFQRLGEFDTHGVGPHEILLAADGRTLVVANGGIETHPDFGRAKLNLDSMRPSIVFLDRETGARIDQYASEPRWHQLSTRHISFDGNGDLWFGCQYQGPANDEPPLIGRIRRGVGVTLFDLPDPVQHTMRNYIGSVAANRDGDHIAFSSPHGNIIVVTDTAGKMMTSFPLTDGCGLAPLGRSFLATSGEGRIVALGDERQAVTTDVHWDDHIAQLG